MAESFGARLLKDITHEEETLDKLLSSLCASLPIDRNPRVPALPFLRDLLKVPEYRDGSDGLEPIESLARGIPSSPSPPLGERDDGRDGRREVRYTHAPLMEILSAMPGGRAVCLLSYIVACLLQARAEGAKTIVLYFDSAWKISIRQIYALLLDGNGGDEVAAMETLSCLHVLRPGSSRELLVQLRGVEEYLYGLPDQECVVAGIVLADLSVWYWSERLEEDGGGGLSREGLHVMIVEVVRRIQSRFGCLGVVSGLGIGGERGVVRSGLAGPWGRSVDVRLLLEKSVDGKVGVNVDATKWIQACGGPGSSSHGKGMCEMYTEGEVVKVTQFKHGP